MQLKVWEAIATLHNYRIGIRPLAHAMFLGMSAGKDGVKEAMRKAPLYGGRYIALTDAELEEEFSRENFNRLFELITKDPEEAKRISEQLVNETQGRN